MRSPPVKSREVYSTFDKAVKPWATTNHFRSIKPGVWSRPVSQTEDLEISAQVNKHGYDATGSNFTVNFELESATGTRDPHPFDLPETFRASDRSQRIGWLLSSEDQSELDDRHRRVIAKIDPADRDDEDDLDEDEDEDEDEDPSPGAIDSDIWFQYVDLDDVRGWCEFLTARLGQLIENFFLGLPHTRRPSLVNADAVMQGLLSEHTAEGTTLVVPRSGAASLRAMLDALDDAPRVVVGTAFQLMLVPKPGARSLQWDVADYSLDPTIRMTLWPGRAQIAELVVALGAADEEPITLMEAAHLRLRIRTD